MSKEEEAPPTAELAPKSDAEEEEDDDREETEGEHPSAVLMDNPLERFEQMKAASSKVKAKETALTDFNERWENHFEEFKQFKPGTWHPQNFYGAFRDNGTLIGTIELNEEFFHPSDEPEVGFEYIPVKMGKKIADKEYQDSKNAIFKKTKEELRRMLRELQGKEQDQFWRTYDEIGRLIITPTKKLVEFLAEEDRKALDEEIIKILERKKRVQREERRKKKEKELKKNPTGINATKSQAKFKKQKELKECKPADETPVSPVTPATPTDDVDEEEEEDDIEQVDDEEDEGDEGDKQKRTVRIVTVVERTNLVSQSRTAMKPSPSVANLAQQDGDDHHHHHHHQKKKDKFEFTGRVAAEPCYKAADGVYRTKPIRLQIGKFKQVNLCRKALPIKNVDWVESTLVFFYGQHQFRDNPPPVVHYLTEMEKSLRYLELMRKPDDMEYDYKTTRKNNRAFLKPKASKWPCDIDMETKHGGHTMRALPRLNCCREKPKPINRCSCRRPPWEGYSFPGCCQLWPRTPFGIRKPKPTSKKIRKKWGWWLEPKEKAAVVELETVHFIILRKTRHMYFELKATCTLNDLKRAIEGVIYAAPRDQRLYKGSFRLHGAKTLAAAGFNTNHGRTNPAVLFLRIRKKGSWERMAIAQLSTACPVPPTMLAAKEEIKLRVQKIFNEQYIPWELNMPRRIRRLITNPIHEDDFKKGTAAKAPAKKASRGADEETTNEMDESAATVALQQDTEASAATEPEKTREEDDDEPTAKTRQPGSIINENAEIDGGQNAENQAKEEEGETKEKENSGSNFLDFLD